jgi:hypothetical protein
MGADDLLATSRDEARRGTVVIESNLGWRACMGLAFVCLAMLCGGCATRSSLGFNSYGMSAEPPRSTRFGTVALGEPAQPATFGFQKAKGKLGSAKEAIVDSAELGFSGPALGVIVTGSMLNELGNEAGDPLFVGALAGAAGGIAAVGAGLSGPIVGARELIRSLKKVSPDELARREQILTNALTQMAAQASFRHALVEIGTETIRGGLALNSAGESLSNSSAAGADAVLEVSVDDLRLERQGSSEGSYVLSIKTHARLVRVSDRAVCFERTAEYRSGKCLFLDWTYEGALEGVAETGYKALARYYLKQLLS